MKNKMIVALILLLVTACGDEKEQDTTEVKTDVKVVVESVEQMAKRHIESKLAIPATEKYSYKIYKEHLDGDDKIDAIITVNRLNFAMEEAAKSGKTAKKAEIGFMGNYNYMFYYDGGLNQISPQIAIPSSPNAALKISFENIQSGAYKDILVDFRVLNASFKDYYTIGNHIPRRVFQWKNFDGLKNAESEAYHFEYVEGTMGLVKDILVKKALLVQPTGEIDLYTYNPELKKSNEIVHRFFYDPKQGKYLTEKK